ncbi:MULTISPECIES: DUF2892 domain-containing protein [Dyadobacter]|uniref:DUF2892 domain-containing protein n=2 Tax=Dyadobacter TaxID=120831 RepID=A0A5R9KYI8_9BACT|nr:MULTISPECIES: DUF2892 domain-containing protein [Dyadobacter]QRR01606.1 DUF2892 domain-containing protein [Dyadobacter sandarakinus]TLV01376.1 DUF2892 domain-containing protein [Dyadobacter luticola]
MKTTHELPLNVTLFETILRLCVMMWLPFLLYFPGLIIYLLVAAYYLLVTAMTSFCPIKYLWQRYRHIEIPVAKQALQFH